MIVFHIAERDQWERTPTTGYYRAASIAVEGFIHCSEVDQVIPVANRLYRGQQGLVLLVIDADDVEPEIRYEGDVERFPHIYGPLNVEAVVDVLDFPPGPDGSFSLPELPRS